MFLQVIYDTKSQKYGTSKEINLTLTSSRVWRVDFPRYHHNNQQKHCPQLRVLPPAREHKAARALSICPKSMTQTRSS